MRTTATNGVEDTTPLFPITAAAELARMHPQTLRQYDRLGLVVPARTAGRVRRYSLADITQLREIAELSEAGIGLDGMRHVMELRREVRALRRRVRELEAQVEKTDARQQSPGRIFSAGQDDIIALMFGERRPRGEIVPWQPGASR